MKKIGFLILGLIFFVSGVFAGDLGNITLRFCNGTGAIESQKQAYVTVVPKEEQSLCMQFSNSSSEPLTLLIGAVDGVLTNDAQQLKACRNEGDNQNFGRFLTLPQNTITLSPKSSKKVIGNLLFPSGNGGTVLGCITYSLQQPNQKGDGNMLNILVRKASFVNVLVSGDLTFGLQYVQPSTQSSENLSYNPLLKVYKDVANEHVLVAHIGLQNTGSLAEKTLTTGKVTNIFGYHQEISFDKLVLPGNTIDLIQPLNLPWYGLRYDVDVKTFHEPVLDFQTSTPLSLDDHKGVLQLKTTFFVFPWIIVIIIGVLLIGLILWWIIVKRRKKKKSDQQSSPKKSSSRKKVK